MAKKDELTPVTAEDVAQAWADVETAKSEVDALRNRFVAGDDSVTQNDIASQQGVVEWLELVAQRVEHQLSRYEVEFAIAARKDLRAEILADATENGEELLVMVDALHKAAIEFTERANAHTAQVRGWASAAVALQVPDKGVISAAHEGLGVESGGTVLVDDVRVNSVDPKTILGLLFSPQENGVLPFPADSDRVATARRIVANMGKAAV